MNGVDNQRWSLLRIWVSFQRALGLLRSTDRRRRYCRTLLTPVVTLCSCSPAKEAEYFTTQKYSWPCTNIFSPAACTPGCSPLQVGSCSIGDRKSTRLNSSHLGIS